MWVISNQLEKVNNEIKKILKELINFVSVNYKNWNEKLLEGFIRLFEQVEERIGDLENYQLRFSIEEKEKRMGKSQRPVGHYRMYQYMHIYRWEFLFLKNLFIFVLTHCRRFQKYKEEK